MAVKLSVNYKSSVKTYVYPMVYGIIVEQGGPEVQVVSCLVSRIILLSAWFTWCLVFVSRIGRWHTG